VLCGLGRTLLPGRNAALNPFNGQAQVFARVQIMDALRALDASPVEQSTAVALVDRFSGRSVRAEGSSRRADRGAPMMTRRGVARSEGRIRDAEPAANRSSA
jgi:hypothetical protein